MDARSATVRSGAANSDARGQGADQEYLFVATSQVGGGRVLKVGLGLTLPSELTPRGCGTNVSRTACASMTAITAE